jgi:hypothetical protein
MKIVLISFLIILIIILGFNIAALRRELRNTTEHAEFMEEGNNKLRMELERLMKVNSGNEQILNELDQSLKELDSKIPFATMNKYIPKKVWDSIKPIIDRLKAFQEERESFHRKAIPDNQ